MKEIEHFMNTVHLETGTENKITLVLSCPGACEELKGIPASGKSGENLNKILNKLNRLTKTTDWCRNKVTITNAWDKVEHVCKTNRSEATNYEIKSATNIKRLHDEVKHTERYIICFGKKARLAIEKMIESHFKEGIDKPTIIYARHPGMQSLNQIETDVQGKEILRGQQNATELRLEVIASSIFSQL